MAKNKDKQHEIEQEQTDGCCEEAEECCQHGNAELQIDDPIADLEAKLADAEARALRTLADYQNFQKRAANNEVEARRQGISGTIASLLPVMDNFDLALNQDVSTMTAEQLLGGVEMVRAEFERALGNQGVSAIKPQRGDEFNPDLHEAVAQHPEPEVEPGKIIEAFQTGYMLGERVLRPAKVVVSIEVPSDQSE
ncbi:MAG: nucleotide exchange factor GrpE [Phycisphaera sp.]|nr:MAG: nucleotide exchange factor GrpE [Phycisphaera sp.]